MNASVERVIILLVVAVFVLTSVYSLNGLHFGPITREEAIEISKNSELIKECFAVRAEGHVGEVNYYNSSMVEQLRKWHKERHRNVPIGHSIWQVVWSFTYKETIGGHLVIIIVDAEFGTIADEAMGVAYG